MNVRFELFHKNRKTPIIGNTREEIIEDLYESINWFRWKQNKPITEEEKQQIISRMTAIETKKGLSNSHIYLLPLSFFVSEPFDTQPLRIGLEAEYARGIQTAEPTQNQIKYDQIVGKIFYEEAVLIHIKLDGVQGNSAILELECRPFSVDSKEFLQQLLIIRSVKKAISEAEEGSNVQNMIRNLNLKSNKIKICVELENSLLFKAKTISLGPFVQVTLELPLSRFGDPNDTAILDLIENKGEQKLLIHARKAAIALIDILRPIAFELHGELYRIDSIKLEKLRGYLAQTIMQACQVIHYGKKKEHVRFHIRVAGPGCTSARDKSLLKLFFENENNYPLEYLRFKTTLKQALEEGLVQIGQRDTLKSKEINVSDMLDTIMTPPHSFASRELEFRSSSYLERTNLELRYGMTLVELRTVHSSLNTGILERHTESYERIKNAQTQPEYRSKKIFSI
jgi:hypothetical protein